MAACYIYNCLYYICFVADRRENNAITTVKKIKIQLEEGKTNIDIDKEELLAELNEMEAIQGVLLESLSLSTKVCPTCGKRL